MPLIRYSDMTPFGGNGRDPYADTGNGLRRAACFWRQVNPLPTTYPGFFTDPIARTAQRVNDVFWERLCPDVPPPSTPPDQPFFGGQCPVTYQVFGFVRQTTGLTASQVVSNIPGPILACDIALIVNAPTSTSWQLQIRGANGNLITNSIFTGNRNQVSDWWFRIQRQDGQPDNCGDAPIVIPTPTQPPQVTVNVPITIGGQEFTAPVTAIDLTVNADNTYQFSPRFNFDGVDFSITPEGVDIDVNPQLTFSPQVDVNLNPGSVGGALGSLLDALPATLELLTQILDLIEGGGEPGCDLQPLANYIQCLIEKPNATIEQNPLVANSIAGVYPISSGCVGVIVNRTGVLQPGTKIQSGTGNNPNVEFWGWASFGSSGNFTERTPLNYENTFLIPPPTANQVLINPTFGNTFSALELVEVNACQFVQ